MCLYIHKNSRRLKALEDIKVYKILNVNENGQFLTPYRHCVVEIGKTYESVLNKNVHDKYEVDKGLHTYKKLDEVKTDIENNSSWYGDCVVCKCTIPKNSFYYEGLFDDAISFASTRLKYDRVILRYNYPYSPKK